MDIRIYSYKDKYISMHLIIKDRVCQGIFVRINSYSTCKPHLTEHFCCVHLNFSTSQSLNLSTDYITITSTITYIVFIYNNINKSSYTYRYSNTIGGDLKHSKGDFSQSIYYDQKRNKEGLFEDENFILRYQ
jgi:hypothetical protein